MAHMTSVRETAERVWVEPTCKAPNPAEDKDPVPYEPSRLV